MRHQGRSGIRAYLDDVARIWDTLVLRPTAFHKAGDAVIVFGTAASTSGGKEQIVDVL